MKIGIDASRYAYGQSTGVEWYSWHIINALVKQIRLPQRSSTKNKEIILYSKNFLDLKSKVIPNKRLWTLIGLSKEIKKNPPDVLFVPSHTLPFCLPKRSVITIHDVAFKYLRKSYSFFQYHYLNWSTKRATKKATKIIVPSQATANDLIDFYDCKKDKIVIIPHGFAPPSPVHDNVFKNSLIFKYFGITKAMTYVLFVGRLESKKNLSRLVEAFGKFSKKYPKYKLILAGKRGIGFNKILKTVDKLGLMHKIIMPGYVTEHEKAALYKYCKFFAFPSLYEGFGLPILEAFYYKKPVLCSQVSCLPEVAGDAVKYVDPYDTKSIAEGLIDIAESGPKIDVLVERGSQRLKKFSWKDCAKKTLKILYGQ